VFRNPGRELSGRVMLIAKGDPRMVRPVPRVTVTTTGLRVATDESFACGRSDVIGDITADIDITEKRIARVIQNATIRLPRGKSTLSQRI
jgi:hypothetical protein